MRIILIYEKSKLNFRIEILCIDRPHLRSLFMVFCQSGLPLGKYMYEMRLLKRHKLRNGMDASLQMQATSEPCSVRVTHRAARSCTVEGAASGTVDNSAGKGE
jgi:hypothetical protein